MLVFFTSTAATEIYTSFHTLSLHDALPIYEPFILDRDGQLQDQRRDRDIDALLHLLVELMAALRTAEVHVLQIVELHAELRPFRRGQLQPRVKRVLGIRRRIRNRIEIVAFRKIGRASCREGVCSYV